MCEPNGSHIAALSATHHVPSKSPFGEEDEIGMLNLMTPATRRDVLSKANDGAIFDLSVDYFIGMPAWTHNGDPSFQIWLSHTPNGRLVDERLATGEANFELISHSSETITMFTHCGTHLDSLNHFGYRGEIWNGFKDRDYIGERHWHRCGSEKQPPIIARGVLIDVAAAHGVDVLPDSYGIGRADLEDALKSQRNEVRPGDVVLIRTGRMQLWPDPDRFQGRVGRVEGGVVRHDPALEPGLNKEGAEYLARAGAIVIGADNVALEQWPSADPENWVPVHTYLLAECGVHILEQANLEEIAAAKLYEFAFMAASMRIKGATGSPIRPLVMPLG
jgi:kynurenine formamidase